MSSNNSVGESKTDSRNESRQSVDGAAEKNSSFSRGSKNSGESKQPADGLIEKLISVSRNAKVVTGGKIFTFSVLVAVGDGKGRIGLGRGKAREVPVAIQKAMENARKNMQRVYLNGDTLWYPMTHKFGATKVFMRPASPGTGIIAGGAMRAVFEVLGIKNVLSKTYGSTNPVNAARATLGALSQMKSPEYFAAKRGKSLNAMLSETQE